MTRRVEVAVASHSRLELFPLRVKPDAGGFVVGRPATGAYVALSRGAFAATELLRGGCTIRDAKAALARGHLGHEIRLRGLVETLLEAGLVKTVDSTSVPQPLAPRRYHLTFLRRRHIAWAFSRPAVAAYATVVAAACAILLAQPRYLPRLADAVVASSPALSLAALWGVSLVTLAGHELAHLLAASFLGIQASVSPGNRLFFPVLQTDLTDLWLVDRNQRYLAYAAGMVHDLLLACALVIVLWLGDRHLLPLPEPLYRTLRLTVLVLVAGLLWQLNVYLRTDAYYLIANFTGCHNLWGDARAYLKATLKRLLTGGAPHPWAGVPERQRPMVRAFAALMAVGTAGVTLLGAACLGGLLPLLLRRDGAGHQSQLPLLASLGVTCLWLAAAVLAGRRRRPRVHYLLLSPDDL